MSASTFVTSVTPPCRILEDNELEGLQWRKDANELKLNTIFGNPTHKFPNAFIREKTEERKSKMKR
jgi:hypothetical protein